MISRKLNMIVHKDDGYVFSLMLEDGTLFKFANCHGISKAHDLLSILENANLHLVLPSELSKGHCSE